MKEKNVNTPYDDVFRTLLNDCPDLIIPVLNEAFGTSFIIGRDMVRKGDNKFFFTKQDGVQKEIVSDSHIMVGGKMFHIECQSSADGSMAVRMFEYDVQIAMQHAELDEGKYVVEFPQSAILYLRSTANTSDYVEIQIAVPGDSCSYRIPAIKVRDYSVDDIYRKQLYFLVPFYIFVYEKSMGECEKTEEKLNELESIFLNIRTRLEETCKLGIISEYYLKTILDMSGKVIKSIARKNRKTAERIGDIMGGKILEYEAKTIMNEGRAEGQIRVFMNMIRRGYSVKDAMSLAELSQEQADEALAKLQDAKDQADFKG